MALRTSGLPAPSRHIMLTLSDLADAQTGVIPADRTPSLRELGEWTGLGKGPIAKHLNLLEEHGWVFRTVPPIELARREHARTTYRLAVGAALDADGRPRRGRHAGPAEVGHVPTGDMPCLEQKHGSEHVPMEDMACPQQGHGGHVPNGDKGMSPVGTVPYTDEEETIKEDTLAKNAKPKRRQSKPKNADRPDVERLCDHLADRIEGNGSKRPTITDKWRTAARLLMDADGRTEEQVHKAIDWCQGHEFWRGNILSMPKLREQYDQMRLQAQRANGRASPARQTVERNGMQLKPETAQRLDDRARFEAMDQAIAGGAQLSLEGPHR